MKTQALIETLDLSEATLDLQANTINNVVLIRAGRSQNKRHYDPRVLEAAVPVFEGSKAYANHPNKAQIKEGRDIRDLTGWYSNVRFEGNALRADRHFTPNQSGRDVFAIASLIAEGKAPATLAGLSINALGTGSTQKDADGEFLNVESITHSQSVDDVASPAAGGGYRLTASTGDLMAALLETMDYTDWFEARPEFTKRLQNEMKVARQDEALKAALAEAKTLTESVNSLRDEVKDMAAARDAALVEAQAARHELGVMTVLEKITLPVSWKTDLKVQLMSAKPEAWAGIIESEQRKASAAGLERGVQVTGAGQQISPQITPIRENTVKPYDMTLYDTPEKLAAALRQG